MKNILAVLFCFIIYTTTAQTRLLVVGDVKDAATGEPLAYATVGLKNFNDETVSNPDGKFELSIPAAAVQDTLVITYVGYEKFAKPIPKLASIEHVALNEYTTMLDEVRIVRHQLDLREIDRSVRVIRDNLYAMEGEVTNLEFNDFLGWLEDYNQAALREASGFKLDRYPQSVRDFYERYHKPSDPKLDRRHNRKDSTVSSYNIYPAVNITYESAIEYCKWLTERYNENPKKKKFQKVLFRLPTLKEWQIAALGYDKFQSWDLKENTVEVIVAKDTMDIFKGSRKKMKVDDTILYPWYWVYHMRNRVYNQFGCYLGNFKIDVDRGCITRAYAYDAFSMMGRTQAYFPNNIGLFDVCGNVAEMLDEKGKACGGSWNDPPENSTIQSVKTYSWPDETVGFRVFMQVIEK